MRLLRIFLLAWLAVIVLSVAMIIDGTGAGMESRPGHSKAKEAVESR